MPYPCTNDNKKMACDATCRSYRRKKRKMALLVIAITRQVCAGQILPAKKTNGLVFGSLLISGNAYVGLISGGGSRLPGGMLVVIPR